MGGVSYKSDGANPLDRLSLDELRRRTSMKWRQYPPDILPLWVAEMDVPLPGAVQRALVDAITRGDTGYPTAAAYVAALAGFAERRWGWTGVTAGLAALVPDVMLGIVEVLKLVTGPRDAVVVNSPVYPPFYPFVEHMDRRVIEAPLGVDGRLDLTALEAAFRRAVLGGRPAAYLLCSPHNPTGTVHTGAELAAVAALAGAHGVRVVVDEIHAPLVLPGASHVPYLTVPGAADAFSVISASKAWNLAGVKAALAVAGPAAAADLHRLPEEVSHGASHLGVIAHTAALHEGEDWLDALLVGLDANRRLLADLLAEHLPEIGYEPPQGTYLAWLDCRRLGLDDAGAESAPPETGSTITMAGPAAVFLERGRVALSPGETFGTGGAGFVRLNLATSPTVITEAVRRMAAALG
jgi:cystathionine beta-lyase